MAAVSGLLKPPTPPALQADAMPSPANLKRSVPDPPSVSESSAAGSSDAGSTAGNPSKKQNLGGAFEIFVDAEVGSMQLGPLDPFMSGKAMKLALDAPTLMSAVWDAVFKALPGDFPTQGAAEIGDKTLQGWTAPWTVDKAAEALLCPGKYLSAINFFWLALRHVVSSHANLCWRSILNCKNFFFWQPCDCPHLCATVGDTGPLQTAQPAAGSLTPHGNAEVICALGLALAESIKLGSLSLWLPYLRKIPCTVYHSDDKSTNVMLRVKQSQTIGLMNDNCKMTALAESVEFHELEIELVKKGVKGTQAALADYLGTTAPWSDVNTSWSSARVIGALRSVYSNLVLNVDAYRLLSEIQLLWGNECLVGQIWTLNELSPSGVSPSEIVYILQCLKTMFKRQIIADPQKVSKVNLKGRSDRGDTGLVELCRVRFALTNWAESEYGRRHVRPEIYDKLANPEVFDAHSPCEKETQLDRKDVRVDLIAMYKKQSISAVESTYIDFLSELHTSMLDTDIKTAMKKNKAYHDTATWMGSGDAIGNFKLEFENGVRQDRLATAPATVDVKGADAALTTANDSVEEESVVQRRTREIRSKATGYRSSLVTTLVVSPAQSVDETFAALKSDDAVKAFVGQWGKCHRAWILDDCCLPEAGKSPWLRAPDFGSHGKKMLEVAVRLIGDGDMVFVLVSTEANAEVVREALFEIKKSHAEITKQELHLHFEENQCRRSKCRGAAGAANIGWVFVVMQKYTLRQMKKQPRSDKYKGTTHSCAYVGLSWPSVRSLPMIASADKKGVYDWSQTFQVNVSTLDTSNAKLLKKAGSFKGMLPLVWFARDSNFIAELLRNYQCSNCVVLCAGDGAIAQAGLLMADPIMTVNVCWTSLHRKFLNTVVESYIVGLMANKDQKHFYIEDWEAEIGSLFPHLFVEDHSMAEQAAASESSDGDPDC